MRIQDTTKLNSPHFIFHPSPDRAKLEKAAESFESFFVYQMIQTMRKTVSKTDVMNGGFAEDTFTSLLDQQYADSAANNYDFGIAKSIINNYLKYTRGNDGSARYDGESLGGNSLPHSPAELYGTAKFKALGLSNLEVLR